jgi:hypothetical protein
MKRKTIWLILPILIAIVLMLSSCSASTNAARTTISSSALTTTSTTSANDSLLKHDNATYEKLVDILLEHLPSNVQVIDMQAKVVVSKAGNPTGTQPLTGLLDFGDVSQGSEVSKKITIVNTSEVNNEIRVYILGSISQLIDIVPGSVFTLAAGNYQDITFKLMIPAGETDTGRVIILRLP